MITILLIILVLFVIGVLPTWPYGSNWGYYPSGGLGIAAVVILIFLLMGPVCVCCCACKLYRVACHQPTRKSLS